MKDCCHSLRHEQVLGCLSSLPKKILTIHDVHNVPEFILHDICSESCFNIIRAAYFVDNPDFDCFKGVAGFCRQEAYQAAEHMWSAPEQFSAFMKISPFNNTVRALTITSYKAHEEDPAQHVARLAPQLGFINPSWCNWDLKHYNQGLIIYEKADLEDHVFDEHFINTLHLLGFCAIQ